MSWFDLITVQEVNDNLRGILAIGDQLASKYELLFSDASGNQERQAFLSDRTKVSQLEEVGRLSIPPSQTKDQAARHDAHLPQLRPRPLPRQLPERQLPVPARQRPLFFGSDKAAEIERRILENYAVAWWANKRRNDQNSHITDTIPLGDFNLPKAVKGDPVYDALTDRGLKIPDHPSQIGSAIASDNHYDQIAFFPGSTQDRFTGQMNVFDFDNALFRDLCEDRGLKPFLAYARYHISDHRPLWVEFKTN